MLRCAAAQLEDYGGEEDSSWVLLEPLGEGEAGASGATAGGAAAAGPTAGEGEAGPSGARPGGDDDVA